MPTETTPMSTGEATPAGADERLVLMEEIDFKWLMTGQGWWIDTWRLHTDTGYANHMLQLVEHSPSAALRACAARLHASLGLGCVQ